MLSRNYERRDGGGAKCYSSTYRDEGNIYMHTAWMVKWKGSDHLTVDLPDLSDQRSLAYWQPGMDLGQDEGYPSPESRAFQRQFRTQIVPIMVVVIVVFCALVGGCIWCCVRSCKTKKRRRLASEEQQQIQQQELTQQKQIQQQEGVQQPDQPVVEPEKQSNAVSEKETSAV